MTSGEWQYFKIAVWSFADATWWLHRGALMQSVLMIGWNFILFWPWFFFFFVITNIIIFSIALCHLTAFFQGEYYHRQMIAKSGNGAIGTLHRAPPVSLDNCTERLIWRWMVVYSGVVVVDRLKRAVLMLLASGKERRRSCLAAKKANVPFDGCKAQQWLQTWCGDDAVAGWLQSA